MKMNKNLAIELLSKELLLEREEHLQTKKRCGKALAEFDKWNCKLCGRVRDLMKTAELVSQELSAQQEQIDQTTAVCTNLEEIIFEIGGEYLDNIQADIEAGKAAEDMIKNIQADAEKKMDDMEDLIFELGDDLDKTTKELIEAVVDLQDLQADSAADRSELIKRYHETMDSYAAETEKYKSELNQIKGDGQTKNENEAAPKDSDKKMIKELQGTIYEDKKYKYDLEQKIAEMATENIKLLKIIEDLKASKEEPSPFDVKQPTTKQKDPRDPKEISMITCKNKLCNKGYAVKVEGKMLVATKDGTRKIEVAHAELPGSLKYTVCGQTCFEFDKAVKASVYGIKAIMPTNEAEAVS